MRRRLLEIGYTFSLLRYAIWAGGLIYLGLLLYVCATSANRFGSVDRWAVERATEFAVLVVPALCAVQSAVYFGNAFGRMRIEWRPVPLRRQLVDILIVTFVTYLLAAIVFRILSVATISLLPKEPHPTSYRLWEDKSTLYLFLHALFAMLLAPEVFCAAAFFGSSFRHPILTLTYQGVTAFALFKAAEFLFGEWQMAATDILPTGFIAGLALLIVLPLLIVIPVLLTAIQRTSDGWRTTFIVAIPLIASVVCFSMAMRWIHQRSITILRSVTAVGALGESPNHSMYRLIAQYDTVSLDAQSLLDGLNRAGSGPESSPALNLHNNRGDVVTLFPDGSMSVVYEAADHPFASPLSGSYPLTGKYEPLAVASTTHAQWLFGREREHTAHHFLRFIGAHGERSVALPNLPSVESYPRIDWGIRTYKEGVLIAMQPVDSDNDANPESLTFFHYTSPDIPPSRLEANAIREVSTLNGLKVKTDDPRGPHSVIWTDSSGQHDCPLPSKPQYPYHFTIFASVLHGEPFLWIPSENLAARVPQTFCHRGGAFTADLSADAVMMLDDNLVVTSPDRLWLIRSFAQAPESVQFSSYNKKGAPISDRNRPLHIEKTTIWYSDGDTALRTVDVANGDRKLLHNPRFESEYAVRRDGIFVAEQLQWSYVPWYGAPKHFGLLFSNLAK